MPSAFPRMRWNSICNRQKFPHWRIQMTRYIKTACLVVVVAFALVSAVFFSYKCIRQATVDAAPEETTEMAEATETVPKPQRRLSRRRKPSRRRRQRKRPCRKKPFLWRPKRRRSRSTRFPTITSRNIPTSGTAMAPLRPAEAASPRWLWSQPI